MVTKTHLPSNLFDSSDSSYSSDSNDSSDIYDSSDCSDRSDSSDSSDSSDQKKLFVTKKITFFSSHFYSQFFFSTKNAPKNSYSNCDETQT